MIELPQWLKDLSADGWAAVAAFIALALSAGGAVTRSVRWYMHRRRAVLGIELEAADGSRPGRGIFRVWNGGGAAAKRVDIEFHTDPAHAEDDPRFISETRLPFPIPELPPDAEVRIPTMLTVSVPSYFKVTLSWSDRRRGTQTVSKLVTRP